MGVTLQPSFKRPCILPLVRLWPLIPPFPTVSMCLAGLRANLPVPASRVVTIKAAPYLLRLGQLPQNKVDAADVKADFGRGVLDGREGIQGCPPLLPVCCTHPFLPQPDRLHEGHGAVRAGCGISGGVAALAPLLVLPCGAARPLWLSSAYMSASPAARVANLAGSGLTHVSETQPWDGEVGQRLPLLQRVSTLSCHGLHARSSSGSHSSPLRVLLLRVFHEKPWILSAGSLISQI